MNYNSMIKEKETVMNYEGEKAYKMTPEMELYTAVVTSALSDKFYESNDERMERIAALIRQVDPQFVAKLAVYTRTQMNLRSIPMLLIVELAKIHNGDSLVRRTIEQCVLRADEIMELLMCYQLRNSEGKGVKKLSKLSRQVQEGLKSAFNRFDEYQFAKYNRSNLEVKLRDALFIVHPKAESEAQQAIFDKIVSDSLQTPYTWETQLSELGQKSFASQEEKQAAVKALWEELIDSNKVGYMALLRNLRNILQAQVSPAHIEKVAATISDPVKVENSKQLPFRFLAAYKELTGVTSVHTSTLLSALERAVKASVANLEGFGPDTNVLVAADVSGSMFSPISMRSSVMNYDIGILLSMLLKSKCSSVISGMFGDTWEVLNLPQENILANTIEMKEREGEVGYSTNGYAVIDYLIENNIRMDKVMMFTDTSAATSTLVSGPNPSRLATDAFTALSSAESNVLVCTDVTLVSSLYAARKRNGNCFEFSTFTGSEMVAATFSICAGDTCAWRIFLRLRRSAIYPTLFESMSSSHNAFTAACFSSCEANDFCPSSESCVSQV